jgi:hypothetical protein
MYAHPSFKRDHPDLLIELRKISGTSCPSTLRRNWFVSELMTMSASTPLVLEQHATTNFTGRRSITPTLSQTGESRPSSVNLSPINDNLSSIFSYTVSKVNVIDGGRVGHEYQRRRLQKEQRPQAHQFHQLSHKVVPSLNCIPIDSEPCSVQDFSKQAKSSASDRGKLDLLAMALEYECFSSVLAPVS